MTISLLVVVNVIDTWWYWVEKERNEMNFTLLKSFTQTQSCTVLCFEYLVSPFLGTWIGALWARVS
jgi:hypothetical protein